MADEAIVWTPISVAVAAQLLETKLVAPRARRGAPPQPRDLVDASRPLEADGGRGTPEFGKSTSLAECAAGNAEQVAVYFSGS